MCRVDGVYDDRVSCSNESVLTNLHLSLITQMLKVRIEVDVIPFVFLKHCQLFVKVLIVTVLLSNSKMCVNEYAML